MKIIEGMKKVENLLRKAADIRKLIAAYHVHYSHETPSYADTKKQVKEWIQAHSDLIKLVRKVKEAIQRTNLATEVTIELGGKPVTHTIVGWIHRRRDLAKLELECWSKLNDKGLKEEGVVSDSTGASTPTKIVRNYDPAERDKMKEMYTSEPSEIDGRLEVINAVTDLIEE